VVAVEYFSKWIEAKPLATITSATVQKFFWQNIICRFGVPKAITVDNGTQFDAETFKTFCDQIGMKIHFAYVRHLESNGLVERANKIVGVFFSAEGPQDKNTFDKVILKSSLLLPKVLKTKTSLRSNDAKCRSYHQLRFRSSRG
jgi:transposase InsO family protein